MSNTTIVLHHLDAMPMQTITSTFSKKTICGAKQMVVWASLKQGGHAATHSHKEEQTFWVTSGCMRVRIGHEDFTCPAGSVITVPSFAEHEATALEDTTFVSFLSGVRQDLVGTDVPEHFRGG